MATLVPIEDRYYKETYFLYNFLTALFIVNLLIERLH